MRWRELSECPLRLDENTQSIGLPDGRVLVNGEAGAFLLDPVADRWERTQPSLLARDRGFAITAEGLLLACGGVKGAWLQDGCELFRPDTSSWHAVPALPTPASNLACATARGRVFAIGGYALQRGGGGAGSKATHSWAPGELTWQRHADAPFDTWLHRATAYALVDDSLVMAFRAQLARFDGAWSVLEGGVEGAAMAPLADGGFLVAGGGAWGREAIAEVRAWNGQWRDRRALPKPRKEACAVRVGERCVILGGSWTDTTWDEVHDGGEIDMPEGRTYTQQVVHDHAHADLLVETAEGWDIVPAPAVVGACHAVGGQRVVVMARWPVLIDLDAR